MRWTLITTVVVMIVAGVIGDGVLAGAAVATGIAALVAEFFFWTDAITFSRKR